MPKERPILFAGEMVRAILDGRKTKTRRVVKLKCFDKSNTPGYDWHFRGTRRGGRSSDLWQDLRHEEVLSLCPHGSPGHRLWVRETWARVNSECGPGFAYKANGAFVQPEYDGPNYGAGPSFNYEKYPGDYCMWYSDLVGGAGSDEGYKWTPSIHMPRWASRITLGVTDVRIERLQDITASDARADGCEPDWDLFDEYTSCQEGWLEPEEFVEECEDECDWVNCGRGLVHSREHKEWLRDRKELATKLAFANLWRRINGVDSWHANPWVWVIEFRRLQQKGETN
jgi:hypothetical protein